MTVREDEEAWMAHKERVRGELMAHPSMYEAAWQEFEGLEVLIREAFMAGWRARDRQ
jgi:hypothetical protein